jgi:hypothetical protein
MAITVHWDDGTTAVWHNATKYERAFGAGPRAPYLILNEEEELALVPDFGVRYLTKAERPTSE